MKPPKREKKAFERVPKYDEWISGVIQEIEYDENHEKKFNGETKTISAVRFKLELKDCEYPKRSRWLTFSYAEKANLYRMFISQLVENAEPDMDFDLDELKGFEVKTMWTKSDDGEFDNLAMIRPLGDKYDPENQEPAKPEGQSLREAAQARNPEVPDDVPF